MSNNLSNVNFNGSLNMDDVLTVVTSRAETNFNQNLAEAKKKASALEKDIKAKQDKIGKMLETECLAQVKEKVDALRPTIESMGGKVTAKPEERNSKDVIRTHVIIQYTNTNSYNNQITFTVEGAKSNDILEQEKELSDLHEALTTVQQEALGWRKKLQSIPTLERQYKAKIAEAKLATSEDGLALLDILTGDLEKSMLALPAN
jgi:predicted RNA-binding protein